MGSLEKHAVRDAAVVAFTLGLWIADTGLRDVSGATAVGVACAAGALTAVAGYLAHEWGHLLGARLSGSVVHIPPSAFSLFLFNFNSDRNGRAQFLVMSLGGFIASAAVVVLLLRVLPLHALSGRVAMGLTALGVLATVVLELPPCWRVFKGGAIPRGAAYKAG